MTKQVWASMLVGSVCLLGCGSQDTNAPQETSASATVAESPNVAAPANAAPAAREFRYVNNGAEQSAQLASKALNGCGNVTGVSIEVPASTTAAAGPMATCSIKDDALNYHIAVARDGYAKAFIMQVLQAQHVTPIVDQPDLTVFEQNGQLGFQLNTTINGTNYTCTSQQTAAPQTRNVIDQMIAHCRTLH